MGKSSKKSASKVDVAPLIVPTTNSGKKGKRETEVVVEKRVSVKKQNRVEGVEQAVLKQKSEVKTKKKKVTMKFLILKKQKRVEGVEQAVSSRESSSNSDESDSSDSKEEQKKSAASVPLSHSPLRRISFTQEITYSCGDLNKGNGCIINVDICLGLRAVKYLYKYIYKGHKLISPNDRGNTIDGFQHVQDTRLFMHKKQCGGLKAVIYLYKYIYKGGHDRENSINEMQCLQDARCFIQMKQIGEILN